MSKVFWCVPMERSIQEYAAQSLLNVAANCGAHGYDRIFLPYMRVDTARNWYTQTFLDNTSDDNDTLVMLDCDMTYPVDIVHRLANYPVGVVGGLYFRRSEPYDPLMYLRNPETGMLHAIMQWDQGAKLIQCDVVATGAIAIKRWVFKHLEEKGIKPPFFRYGYTDSSMAHPTEDVYFGVACQMAGIPHYCDVGVDIRHLTVADVSKNTWTDWLADHPEPVQTIEVISNDYQ